ncbi:MAG: hypothetical protein IJ274_01520 [Lachnospiraceae bacterium]|nr:hypothetical protein [Lachnospiraceae bacterium]
MGWEKQIKEDMFGHGNKIFRVMSIPFFLGLNLIVQVVVLIVSSKGGLFPGTETIAQVAGTCAEIIAGLYGITLAGYTFFLSRMDALMESDMTLDFVVASVKNRFKYLIWFITINVILTLFNSIFLMYCPAPQEGRQEFWYRLFCNEFLVFLAFSIVLILYYSVKVIEPNCLKKEAAKLKRRISRLGKLGSVTSFISDYDRMESLCNSLIPGNVLNQLHENKGKRFEYTIELLAEQYPMLRPMLPQILRVHIYYECTVNCTPMTVTQEMCIQAEKVVTYLEDFCKRNTGKISSRIGVKEELL